MQVNRKQKNGVCNPYSQGCVSISFSILQTGVSMLWENGTVVLDLLIFFMRNFIFEYIFFY